MNVRRHKDNKQWRAVAVRNTDARSEIRSQGRPIASDRLQNVRAWADNEPDNDHTNTPRSTQIGRLFLLSSVQRLTVHGKRVDIGLGSPRWGATTLSEARARAMSNYRIARNGGDPRAAKRQVPAFADGIEAVLAIQREAWRDGGKSEKQWRSSLATYARPLMDKPLDAIGPGDVLAVLVPIWSAKRETARRVKQRIGRS